MKIVDVTFFYDKKIKSAEELLGREHTTTGWAEALQKRGVEVIVVKRFHQNYSIEKNIVPYLFLSDKLGERLKNWQIPFRLFKKINELDADVVHLHHLSLSVHTLVLRLILKRKTAIIIQHHGGKSQGRLKRAIHNMLNRVADGFFFTTEEQGKFWLNKKSNSGKILPVMEGSTFFNYDDRDRSRSKDYQSRSIAREHTGMNGSRVFIWVGHLDANKDPVTVLQGFKTIFYDYPYASLYMIYDNDNLLNEVRNIVSNSETLKTRVHLLGHIAHEQIDKYYNSADYFVLGSHYEGSGYALSEALRCGCVPVITNIPSFCMMTDNGRLGCLWNVGDSESFVNAVRNAMNKPLMQEAAACIDFFNRHLSFDAIAETVICHYQTVIEKRQKKLMPGFSNA
jgi:glycosyltransferase involved in cell wall biosynthesis